MATVYRARDLKHDRDVAIKVLRPELAAVAGRDRFLREIQLAARLKHPHMLPLSTRAKPTASCTTSCRIVEGQTLRDVVATTPAAAD